MFTTLFLKGWLVGFSIAMPVGPIGILCLRHALIRGAMYGLAAGLGASVADACYGALAGFGMTTLLSLLIDYQFWFQVLGSLFLCYLGIHTLLTKSEAKEYTEELPSTLGRIFVTTFFLTLTSPLTIFSFAGLYAGLGIGGPETTFFATMILTSGVFIGSAAWWVLLSAGLSLLGCKLNLKLTHLINKISGTMILTFGVIMGVFAFQQVFPLSVFLGW